jgi:hypothetical protein
MIEYILIIAFYAGTFADTDSVSIESVNGFSTKAECQTAGTKTKEFATIHKEVKYVCVERTVKVAK